MTAITCKGRAASINVVERTPAYDGKGGFNLFGCCSVCGCDVQQFCTEGKPEKARHYASHKYARRLKA